MSRKQNNRFMIAKDLFWKGCYQVFSCNTGNFDHFIRPWDPLSDELQEKEKEIKPEPELVEEKDECQLELF